jgi:hypothetical protein
LEISAYKHTILNIIVIEIPVRSVRVWQHKAEVIKLNSKVSFPIAAVQNSQINFCSRLFETLEVRAG